MKFTYVRFFVCIAVCVCLNSVLFGQEMTLNIKAATAGGDVLNGAVVSLLNSNTSEIINSNDGVTISNLKPGSYTLQVTHAGYASVIQQLKLVNDTSVTTTLQPLFNQLDDVVVSGGKTEADAQTLPASITTFNSNDVRNYQLQNTKQLTAIVPNLYSSNPGDNRNVTSIRGIATTSYDPAVATYIDGVNQFSLDAYMARLLNIQRIEVLRGPQGTLYGRSSTGGIINIITKKPDNATRVIAEATVGNYGLQRYNAGVSFPVINNKLFAGITGMYEGFNGFFENDYNNSKFDKQHSIMGNYFLKYVANNKLSVTLNAKHLNVHNNGAFPLATGLSDVLANDYKVNQNATTTMKDNTFNTSLNVNYSGTAFNFISQTAYQNNYRYYTDPIDGDFSPLDAVSLINNYGNKYNNVKVFTQEFRFTSPARQTRFNWLAGLYAFTQKNPVKQATHFGEDAAAVGSPLTNFSSINTNKLTGYGLAVFAQASYQFTAKLSATAGLRYDYENKKQHIEGAFQQDGDEAFITQPDTSAKANYNAVSPKLSLAYQITNSNLVYASYNAGFRPGGISQLSSDPSQPPLFSYKPEHSHSFEAGIKNTFLNKKLLLNIAAFYTTINDVQVPTLILPDAITVTKNAGKLTSKGIEAEIKAKPVKGLQLNYNFGYTDAYYKDLNLASNGESVKLDGNKQVFTPNLTSAFSVQYDVQLGKQILLSPHIDWLYIGKQYFDLANQLSQSAYHLINAQLGINISKVGFYIWSQNLLNKKYIDYAYDFGAAHLGAPSTYGITLRFDDVFTNNKNH